MFRRELVGRSVCYTRLLPRCARINYPSRANHYFGRFCHLLCAATKEKDGGRGRKRRFREGYESRGWRLPWPFLSLLARGKLLRLIVFASRPIAKFLRTVNAIDRRRRRLPRGHWRTGIARLARCCLSPLDDK